MNNQVQIPFVDVVASNWEVEEELQAVFNETLRSGISIGGPYVEQFEKDFARFCGVKHCIGVSSGTDALRFALLASGIQQGDGVITVPNTFIATTEAISQAGAVPHFVDVHNLTGNMSADALFDYLDTACYRCDKTGHPIDRRTGRRITAVVPVHLSGQMAEMDPIRHLAREYRLTIIEDACQAHGAEYFSQDDCGWKRAGSIGTAAGFSFYPTKNLGACGEGGAVTTNDDRIAEKVRLLRDHGQSRKYHHVTEGYNGRLDALQAGILSSKLRRLRNWNNNRWLLAQIYNQLFRDMPSVATPYEPSWTRSIYHLYVLRVEGRDELQSYLTDRGIGTGLHYPVPLHLQQAYAHLGYEKGSFPVAEDLARRILSLPMYPQLRKNQQEQVASAVKRFYTAQSAAA